MKKENGKENSKKNGYNLYASIIVSDEHDGTIGIVTYYMEKRDDIYVKYYVISKKHIEKLARAGIILAGAGCHHFVPQTLSSKARTYICNGNNNSQVNTLKSVAAEMDFNLVISMPNFLHQNHNRVFAGDFTPEEALRKLDWILDSRREFIDGYKIDIIDLFSVVSIFGGKDAGSSISFEEILKLKENDEVIVPKDLMEKFNIKKEDIVEYLENFFFYPQYDRYYKHFEMLSNFRTTDRVRKSRVQVFMNYEPEKT